MQAVVSKNRLGGWGQSDLGVCSSASEIVTSSAAECDPLHQIYRNANRNSWTGVTCNPAGEVVCIHLQGFSLHGAAAGIATLQDLPSLGYLNLADNELSGEQRVFNLEFDRFAFSRERTGICIC